jgi:RNA polymerase sigma-70 factor (ECF subfamily)
MASYPAARAIGAPDLESIWEEYCCRLLAFLRGRVSDESQAEDILQEVFIRVHQHLCCPPPVERMESWIYQITRNLIIDYYRQRREVFELPEDFPAEMELPVFNAEASLAGSLRGMIDELPEPYREALVLTEYQGLSQVELAHKLGISISGAKSRVQRARDKLRDFILACCHLELDRRGRVMDFYPRCCCCNPAA